MMGVNPPAKDKENRSDEQSLFITWLPATLGVKGCRPVPQQLLELAALYTQRRSARRPAPCPQPSVSELPRTALNRSVARFPSQRLVSPSATAGRPPVTTGCTTTAVQVAVGSRSHPHQQKSEHSRGGPAKS